MAANALISHKVTSIRRTLVTGAIAVLVITIFVLIGAVIPVIVTTPDTDSFQADLVPVVQNPASIVAVPVPPPPTIDIHRNGNKISALIPMATPSPLPVPVPAPRPPSIGM